MCIICLYYAIAICMYAACYIITVDADFFARMIFLLISRFI